MTVTQQQGGMAPPNPHDRVPECPYVGLVPFEEANETYFFGRERERDLILANLTASRLTLLYAASGVGKSSVLRAAVLPHARRLAEEAYEDFGAPGALTVYVSDWSRDASTTVAQGILDAVAHHPGAAPVAHSTRARLELSWLREVLSQSGVGAIHLILDQFEEYFLYHSGCGGAQEIIEELGDILSARDMSVNVVLAIREDALASLDLFKGRIPHLFGNYLRLAPLDRRAGRAAILGPLKRYDQVASAGDRLSIEPELVETLLDQVQIGRVAVVPDELSAPVPVSSDRASSGVAPSTASTEIEAPYLQLVLTRLWREERAVGSTTLRGSTLERLGGAQTIVRTHLDQVIADLTPPQVEVAAAVFHHLVTTSGSKIALTAEDLADWSGRDVGSVRDLLETLCAGRQRILRPVPPPVGSHGPTRYEIYHDVMGAAVLDWRRRYVAMQQRDEADRQLVAEREAALIETATTRRRLRRVRLIAAGLALVLLVVAGLGVVLYVRDREARQQSLLSEAAAALDTDPALSLAKSTEALAIEDDAEAREAVLVAASAPRSTVIAGPASADENTPKVMDMEVTPEGRHIVAYYADGGIQVMDPEGDVEARASASGLSGIVVNGVVSRDAERAAVATVSGEVALVDLVTGNDHIVLSASPTYPALTMIDSPDGEFLVVSSQDQSTLIYDASTGDRVAQLATVSYESVGTPDGLHVITSDSDYRLRVWDLTSGEMVKETPALSGAPAFLQFYGDVLVAVATDYSAGTHSIVDWNWAAVKAEPRSTPIANPRTELLRAWVDPATGILLLAVDKTVWAFDLEIREFVRHTVPAHADWVYDARGTADLGWVVTSGGDGRILVWSTYNGNRPTAELRGHRGAVVTSAFISDGTSLVSMGIDGTVRLWSLPSVMRYEGHDGWVLDLDSSPDGRFLATASRDGSIRIISPDMSEAPPELSEAASIPVGGVATRVRFDPRDSSQVFVLKQYARAPELWRWSESEVATRVPTTFDEMPGPGYLTSMDVNREGTMVVAGDVFGHVYLWDVETGRMRDDAEYALNDWVGDVAFDDDGERLAAVSHEDVRVWDLSGGEDPLRLDTSRAASVVFDVQGAHIAVAAEGGTIDLYTSDGDLMTTVVAHGGRVGHPMFSADGKLLAVGTAEGLIEVRDVKSGRTIMLSRVHGDSVNDVAFLPVGNDVRIVSASDDTTVVLSECAACTDPNAVVEEARDWVDEANGDD